MKIIGFTQIRNELSKGNLINWLRQMFEICEYVYIYDQNSDDGSKIVYKNYPNLIVIESEINDFKNEITCKSILLEKLLKEHPDTDFILWLDGDSLLDRNLTNNNNKLINSICEQAQKNKIDGILFKHYNLWRSDVYYRIDNSYHNLNNGVCALWRNNGNLSFNKTNGLHLPQYPNGIKKMDRIDFGIIHRGFATDYQIMTKYDVYKSYGQNGWDLDRLLDESTLDVVKIDENTLPKWFEITDKIIPTEKEKIIDIYNKRTNKNIEIISLIFKSVDYLKLIYNELKSDKCKLDGWDVSVRIVANDATPEVIENLKTLDIPYTIYNDPKPNDYYLNRVYRCFNHAGKTSKSDNICFVNSDMVFSEGWLFNLLKHHDGINIPCSKLVESGKMLSGTHAISYNCGKTPKDINYTLWNDFVKENKTDEIKDSGLYMPCIFEKNRFIESGMYPEGNIYSDGSIGTLNGGVIQSGDDWYIRKLEKEYNMKHVTVFDSLVYHIQEGEKDE
jgi:hypothetical protein